MSAKLNSEVPIVALYVRVSTKYQEDKDSLPHQIKELKAYCKHVLHLENMEVFEDAGKSGKNTNRPAFERMMKKVKAGRVSHVLVYKIDRISRNLVDFSIMYDDFKSNRTAFISLNEQFDTSTAMGEAMLKIVLIFAELERKMTSERVTDIMIGRAAEGLWNGANVPYGYTWNEEKRFPVPDPVEAARVKEMFNLYDRVKSSCKIRDYLNTNNIPTKRNGEWSSKTVADIIRNPFYKGTYRYNYRESPHGKIRPKEEWIVRDDNHEAIISKEQWDRCNALMDINANMKNKIGSQAFQKYTHVFGKMLYCGHCGSPMLSDKDRIRANGFFPSVYRCGNYYRKNTCKPPYASEVKIGPFVFNYISNMVKASKNRSMITSTSELELLLLQGPEFKQVVGICEEGLNATFDALKCRLNGNILYHVKMSEDSENNVPVNEISRLENELTKITRGMERLKKLYLFEDNAISEKEYLSTKRDLEIQHATTSQKLAELEQETFKTASSEIAFIASASSFLLSHKINSGDHIIYDEFSAAIEDKVLQDFIRIVIEKIIIVDGRIDTICFKNGLEHRFLYKEAE